MHPEVQELAPGICPICGMALEAATISATVEENPELADMTRRFWISLAFTLPVFAVAMGEMLPGNPLSSRFSARQLVWFQLLLATPVVLYCGLPFFQRAAASIASRQLNMFTLIGIGTGAAYGYSVMAALAPGIFPDSFRTHGGSVAVYFEAAAVIVTLVLLGQVLELRARGRTGAAIRSLLGLAPDTALRIAGDGREEEVPLLSFRFESGRPEEGPIAPLDHRNYRKHHFRRICDEASVSQAAKADGTMRRRTPKDLRDTLASQLLTTGVQLGYVSSQLGHSDVSVTARHYARWAGGDAYGTPLEVREDEVPADLLARLASKSPQSPHSASSAGSGASSTS